MASQPHATIFITSQLELYHRKEIIPTNLLTSSVETDFTQKAENNIHRRGINNFFHVHLGGWCSNCFNTVDFGDENADAWRVDRMDLRTEKRRIESYWKENNEHLSQQGRRTKSRGKN